MNHVERAAQLTATLTQVEEMRLYIAVPVSLGADSTDVEYWIASVWREPITSENLDEAIYAFRRYYKEK